MELVEILGVTAVGLALSYGAKVVQDKTEIPVAAPVAIGTGMYVLGYVVRGQRPEQGWKPLQITG